MNLDLPILPPDDLIEACARGDCVLFAGAGLSAQAGFPTWVQFVPSLLEWAIRTQGIDRQFVPGLREAVEMGDYDLVADHAVSHLRGREDNLIRYLKHKFRTRPNRATPVHRSLKTIPFAAALTTNFDNLLEI